jgi:hypothetical protein
MRALLLAAALTALPALADAQTALRAPEDFAAIRDQAERSRALFGEAMKVIGSPRCMNCHPSNGGPTQGDDAHAHAPPVARGPADIGETGMQCPTCHMPANTPTIGARIRSVPGDPAWRVAPVEAGWNGKSAGFICAQLKGKARNGGRDLGAIHTHMTTDSLVAWGWAPGDGRAPAPGTQAQFGALIKAWIDDGAACPAP